MIRFGRAICGDLAQAERREWYLSNGLGAYASGTIAGSLTRRYHGLLLCPLQGVLDRHLLFAKADAMVLVDGQAYVLASNRWQSGAIEPKGYKLIESFRLDGQLPVWVYSFAGICLEQRIFMQQGQSSVCLAYRLLDAPAGSSVTLQLNLLVNQRDHHGQMWVGGIQPNVEAISDTSLTVHYPDSLGLHFQSDSGELSIQPSWVKDFLLQQEHQRGLADWDNHLQIAQATIGLQKGQWQGVRAGLQTVDELDLAALLKQEQLSQARFLDARQAVDKSAIPAWLEPLFYSTKNFLLQRPVEDVAGESIIAGYPWFADWGRDTMIALPGLTLATGQLPIAGSILLTWSRYVSKGMIPNRFPESASDEPPEYNSVDAALWFVLACYSYQIAGGEKALLKQILPALKEVIHWYQKGTRYQIHMQADTGLLHIGQTDTQLTWMDARVNGVAATPRVGKPVEINALWYNALKAMQSICETVGEDAENYADMAETTKAGFRAYRRPDGGLYDVLDAPDGHDASIRPNQIFALSLPWQPLDKAAMEAVMNEVSRHLYTSYGLRSLSPQDDRYVGIYQGGVDQRDASYHNGPVWGWLLGHYAMAHWRLYQDTQAALALLEPVADHLSDAGLGSISEIFDGDAPHIPRGAPSQAWSVATVLEAWDLVTTGRGVR